MADYPSPDHDGCTPLERAHTPAMDRVVHLGLTGLFCPIPDGMPPGSDIGNLSLFGYDPRQTFTGRAPLEAANQGLTLAPNEVAFRCNLVTLHDGILQDFTAGHISTPEATALIATLNEHIPDSLGACFHAGVSYRHLTIQDCSETAPHFFRGLVCTPPHDITGQPYAPHLPHGPGAEIVNDLMARSQALLKDHAINAARREAGQRPATSIWLWSHGRSPSLEPYPARFGIDGAVISAVDLVNGIGLTAGLEVVPVPGATGYLDTKYEGKVQAALEALDRLDFVYLHVEAPDEASHEGRWELKVQAIELFDARVVAPCLDRVRARSDVRLLVAPDHVTALSTRTHAGTPVPFALCGAGVAPDAAQAYAERHAEHAALLVTDGHALIPYLLATPEVTATALKARLHKCHTCPSGEATAAPENP